MTQRTISIALRLLSAAALLAGGVDSARADELLANEVRAGAYFVHNATKAHDLSGPFTPDGINIRVANTTTAYFAYIRHLDDNWGLELAGGVPPKMKTYDKDPATVGSIPFNKQEIATAR